ncbi:MutS-related protein [Mycobacterium sp.]|uniref:MutS-related protein n=1 Tax=Mycobacterium sp. TaxID=1785 RepID=UPI002C3571EA|nr:DNA mismatch repair protein MutS [Mycobacterium sp.]HTQ18896.1 DNA mismatch repair protein MutS [Mycobacterium sp.]
MAAFSSILDPSAGGVTGAEAPPDCFADLHLDEIIATVTAGHDDSDLAGFFYTPPHDLATVHYRQQIFRDLDNGETWRCIRNFVDGMRSVRGRLQVARNVWHHLQRQGWLIDAVETYCQTVALLRSDLAHIPLSSQGLRNFADHVTRYVESEALHTLVADTEAVQDRLHKVRYLVHVQGLRVDVEKFDEQTDYSSEVAKKFERFATEVSKDYHVSLPDFKDMNHVEEQILECVAKLHPEAFTLLNDFCRRHEHFIEPVIARFDREIQFYLSYLALSRHITTAGLTFGYPEVTGESGVMHAEDAFDLALAINAGQDDQPVVPNDFHLSESERVFVVTGPNQGGKTTFARTVGQCAYLASLGCPVPARSARLSLPDQIYTHFERREDLSTLHGKLDDELVRIHDILSRATNASVIIMNESFSSTTVNDSLLIGSEVLTRIAQLRCVAVYVTFLDELSTLDPVCVSMVGEVAQDDPTQRKFKFSRRPADGMAYAAALAEKYGLSQRGLRQRISR